jgi:hypothetical protein
MTDYTFKLLDRPSFIEGMARLFDFSGSLNIYNESVTPQEADIKALKSDWQSIGLDLEEAIEAEKKEQQLTPEK